MERLRKTSLRTLLFLILGLLLLPALLFSLVGTNHANAQQENLEQVRLEIDQINQELNQSVIAPFYMSPRTIDPCNPQTLESVKHSDNLYIESTASEKWEIACEWIYYKDGVLIAKDSWNDYDRKLGHREYFRDELTPLGQDNFFVLDYENRVSCVKQREYQDFDVRECYTESGILISVDPVNSFFSPMPPMLYWFAYR
jgi:hypothetical protein